MSDNESDKCEDYLTFAEIIDEMEQSAGSLLSIVGPAKMNKCTYQNGYLKRQGLFSCKTCLDRGGSPAYICYACSLNCHPHHDIIELWTKRNHRCDCGNKRFVDNPCTLCPNKDPINTKNNYDSHNLRGLYCTCNSTYDPNDVDTMYYCTICEDWFHKSHLDPSLQDEETFDIICQNCSERYHSLLRPYFSLLKYTDLAESGDSVALSSVPDGDGSLNPSENSNTCKLGSLFDDGSMPKGTFTLWKAGWRNELCTCETCVNMYECEGVLFLVDYEDTHEYYTTQCKSPADCTNEFLSQFDRITQLEVLHRLNDFNEEFRSFLSSFDNTGRVITSEDVRKFFNDLTKKSSESKFFISDRCNDPEY